MNKIEVSVLCFPKNEIIAVCKDCKKIIHSTNWRGYADYIKKREKFNNYKTCPFCNK